MIYTDRFRFSQRNSRTYHMRLHALRTAALLYTEGTLTGEDAARYVGTSPENWDAYCRDHGVELPEVGHAEDRAA